MSRCEGGCGASCCRPRKTKRRKVRLVCGNGSQYTKDIEIVRKCACTKKCYWLPGPSKLNAVPHVALPRVYLPEETYPAGLTQEETTSRFPHWPHYLTTYFLYFVHISVLSQLLLVVVWSLCVCVYILLPWLLSNNFLFVGLNFRKFKSSPTSATNALLSSRVLKVFTILVM